jgi:hypothetical protein
MLAQGWNSAWLILPLSLSSVRRQFVLAHVTEMRSQCARDWPSWFLRPASTTHVHGAHDREVAQGERPACDTSHPLLTSHTRLFVRHTSTGRALAPAHSSSDSLSSLGQRTHRRAYAATSKLSTSDSVTSLRACLVKDSSACGQCMLVTSAQGADQDLLSIAVLYRSRAASPACTCLNSPPGMRASSSDCSVCSVRCHQLRVHVCACAARTRRANRCCSEHVAERGQYSPARRTTRT